MSKEGETSKEVPLQTQRRFVFSKKTTDPYSRDFDPFLALKESSGKEERKNIRVFDNIKVFESYMKRENDKSLNKVCCLIFNFCSVTLLNSKILKVLKKYL